MTSKGFEVHLRGELPEQTLSELDNVTARVVPTQTVLTGQVPDQAALIGLLNRLHGLGLEVLEVRHVHPRACGQ